MSIYTSVQKEHLISPDKAAQIIVAALAGPARTVPLACAYLLMYSYGVLMKTRADLDPTYDQPFNHRYKNVLSRTMRFLCNFRSTERLRVLERQPCRCAQGPEVLREPLPPALHRNLFTTGPIRVPVLIGTMVSTLFSALDGHGGIRTLYKATRRKLWPASMNDLVPDGSASFYSIVRWLPLMDAKGDGIVHLQLICFVFEAMPSYLRAGFIKGHDLVEWLHRTITRWMNQPINVHNPALSPEVMATGVLLAQVRHLSANEFLLWLSSSPRHSLQDMCSLLHEAFVRIATYPSHAASDQQLQILRETYRLALQYVVLANMYDKLLRPFLYPSASNQEALPMHQTDPMARLCCMAYGENWNQRCYGPGCITTYADRSKRFKRCGGCQTAEYCSPECQSVAWRHPGAPHREVCGSTGRARVPGGQKMRIFTRRRLEPGGHFPVSSWTRRLSTSKPSGRRSSCV
jgi:hypothetical protein